jgi:Rrf2 family protein
MVGMFIYGKTAANAIAVLSYLAGRPVERAGSGEIAKARKMSQALTAKLLTQLAAAGIVRGQPGPGGGYTLAKEAASINLLQVVALFEQTETSSPCPFGQHYCGTGNPCPMHDTLVSMLEDNRRFLQDTRLSVFLPKAPKKKIRG